MQPNRLLRNRRLFLKRSLNSAAIAIAVTSGLLLPLQASALWNKKAFHSNNLQTAIKAVLGSDLSEQSSKISIKAPDELKSGATVPISVSSTLKKVTAITLFSESNSTPLVAQFVLDKNCDAFIATRIKMRSTSNVIAIISADGKNYSTRKRIKVVTSGCDS
ncbi:MAG: thiosulfate oxidation carrier protein SoxY [Gammaproteobacteria bacterium]|nr:thiosulfate oxidation carrier protein SoxY [Gammaproteobacteria bacterium]